MSSDRTVGALPSYFTSAYFERILRLYTRQDNVSVKSFQVGMATNKGDNYGSDMYRVSIEYHTSGMNDTRSVSIIVKSAPSGQISELIESYDIFTTEILAYEKVFPAIEAVLADSGKTVTFGARYYLGSAQQPKYLVFEDLKFAGYRLAERKVGLDLEHCKLVIEKMALMHAGSVVLQKDEFPQVDILLKSPWQDSTKGIRNMYQLNTEVLSQIVASWGETYKGIANKLDKLKDEYGPKINHVFSQDCKFKVLNHGDLWVNNMMFKYDNQNSVQDVMMVDLQCMFWGSPAIDLIYIMYSSATEEVLTNHRLYLIKFYYQHLVETLNKLEYKGYVPSLLELHIELLQRGFQMVLCSNVVKPMLLLDDAEDDVMCLMSTKSEGSDIRSRLMRNEKYIHIMKNRLLYLDEMGLLDL